MSVGFIINFVIRYSCIINTQYVDDNLCVMSVGFLLSSPDDAVIWRGPKKNGTVTSPTLTFSVGLTLCVVTAVVIVTLTTKSVPSIVFDPEQKRPSRNNRPLVICHLCLPCILLLT